MAKIYSKRLLLADNTDGSPVSAVVPAGVIWVVKSIDVTAATTGNSAAVSTDGVLWWASGSISAAGGADGHATWSGRQVLNAGETLQLERSTGVQGSVSGYELTAP